MSCAVGVLDCHYAPEDMTCAPYNQLYPSLKGNAVLLTFTTVVGCAMAFCIGGNDSANAWASTVGSGAIRLRPALLLGGLGEWLGATMLGAGVSNTISKGVSKLDSPECWACGYCDSRMSVYTAGMLAALIGGAAFLAVATLAKLPVSTTHAIMGGVVGMTIAGAGFGCLRWGWKNLGMRQSCVSAAHRIGASVEWRPAGVEWTPTRDSPMRSHPPPTARRPPPVAHRPSPTARRPPPVARM